MTAWVSELRRTLLLRMDPVLPLEGPSEWTRGRNPAPRRSRDRVPCSYTLTCFILGLVLVAGNSVSILVVTPGTAMAGEDAEGLRRDWLAPAAVAAAAAMAWWWAGGWQGEEGEPVEELDRLTSSSSGSSRRSRSQGGGVLIWGWPGASSNICNRQRQT